MLELERLQAETTSRQGRAPRAFILRAVPEPLSIAQVTPYPWEDRHDVNTFVARVSDELAARGHRVLVVAPSSSRTLVRDSRKAVRAGALEPAPGEARVLAVGEALPPLPGRRRAALPIDVARTISDLFESRRPRPLPRPRAVRAQRGQHRAAPFARAQRRHLPRADRARRGHPGRAQGRAARVRAPRRAHRRLRGDARSCCAASSRATTRSSRPAPTPRRAAEADADGPRAHRLPRAGGARGAARCSCARCAGSIRRCRGTRSCTPSAGRRPRRPCAPTCCERVRFVDGRRRRRWPAPTSSWRPPTASPPRRG